MAKNYPVYGYVYMYACHLRETLCLTADSGVKAHVMRRS